MISTKPVANLTSDLEEQRIYEKVHRMAYFLCGNYHDAWDLSQEVFLELEKGRQKWERAQSRTAWAMGVLHHLFKQYLRSRKRHQSTSLDEKKEETEALLVEESEIEQKAIFGEKMEQIMRAIRGLNREMAEALMLFTLEGLPTKEIAKVQGDPEGTVKWRIFEARRRIAAQILP